MHALQVALDVLSIEDALTIGSEAYEGGANWLEAGTPLIKNHGMTAVRTLKNTFPDATIVADLKTMDTGDIEVEMAAKNGADVVVVLGVAEDMTIKRALNQANAHKIRIMADLLGVKDPLVRALELEKMGVHYILLHTPLDIQRVKLEKIDKEIIKLQKLTGSLGIPVAAAGGVNLDSALLLKEAGISIFIVGRALIKAKDVRGTARKLSHIIGLKERRMEPQERPSDLEIIRTFESIPTPFISDSMRRFGAMRGLKPVSEGRSVAGPAYTVQTLGGDWGKVVKAVDLARPGDIIVVDAQGSELAVWGELATLSALRREIKAVVIDGALRDADDIRRLSFPAWSRHIVPNAGEPHGHGNIGVTIACGGQPVSPGDVVVADDLGIVVIPKDQAFEIMKKSLEIKEKERLYKKRIEEGKTLSELFGL